MFSRIFDRILNTILFFIIACLFITPFILIGFDLNFDEVSFSNILIFIAVFSIYVNIIHRMKTEDTWIETISEWINPSFNYTYLIRAVTNNNIKNVYKFINRDETQCLFSIENCINQTNSNRLTPLMIAVTNKNINIVRLLLENNADPNTQHSQYGFTALNLALSEKYYNEDIIKLLNEYDALYYESSEDDND